jgi:hypothetical protein
MIEELIYKDELGSETELIVFRYLIESFNQAKWTLTGREEERAARERRWKFSPDDVPYSFDRPLECYVQYRCKTQNVMLNCVGLNTWPYVGKFSLYNPEFTADIQKFLLEAKETFTRERYENAHYDWFMRGKN